MVGRIVVRVVGVGSNGGTKGEYFSSGEDVASFALVFAVLEEEER